MRSIAGHNLPAARTGDTDSLRALRERIRALEDHQAGTAGRGISTGWPDPGAGGHRQQPPFRLRGGAVHEWFGPVEAPDAPGLRSTRWWAPPLGVLSHLAGLALRAETSRRWVVWVGRRCRPYPRILIGGGGSERSLLERSVFVDASSAAERVWAIDLALRCRGVAAVVADGSGMSMAASRRLQLAAHAGGVPGLLARPPWELGDLSAARTRWLVRHSPSPTERARWAVELLRCKEAGLASDRARVWTLERDHETGVVCVAAGVPDRSAQATGSAARRTA